MVGSKKKLFLLFIAFISLVGCLAVYYSVRSTMKARVLCPKCNIIMIDIDILRADALPCYGYKRNTTPNICAFGAKGQIFTKNYAQSYWTLPSMFSTITSLYPQAHGVTTSFRDALDPKIPTLAQTLRGAGYKTFYFGLAGPSTISDTSGGTRGYDVVRDKTKIEEWPKIIQGLSKERGPFFAHFYTSNLHMPYLIGNESELLEPMKRPEGFPVTTDEFSALLGQSLYANYESIFTPKAIAEYPSLFLKITPSKIPEILNYFWGLPDGDSDLLHKSEWRTKEDAYLAAINKNESAARPYVRLLYDSVLALLDKKVGLALNTIASSALSSNSIIIIYSDHGEEFGEHGKYNHQDRLYNELINTPLILYVPGLAPQALGRVTQNIDIFPTLTGLTGVSAPETIQGSSLVPTIMGRVGDDTELAISQTGSNKAAITTSVWKLIINGPAPSDDQTELYNLIEDPEEKNEVSGEHPRVKDFLLSELSKQLHL